TQECQEEYRVYNQSKKMLLKFCRCSGQFCNVNWDKAVSRACTVKRIGFGKYRILDYEQTNEHCPMNEPCGKMILYENGRAMSVEGCASALGPLLNNKIEVSSFPVC
uniref:Glycoprotein n=1 Tax=Rhabditophanes sp. KR3021 TaxID=114890 RepID=A0AC35UF62_9BILA